jgi:ketosteroid isomerase-like protein
MKRPILVLALGALLLSTTTSFSQAPADLTKTILHHDSLFWVAYNHCDVEAMEKFFTDDLEFYHDKGGLTVTADSLFKNVRKGLCGNKDFRLRREVVKGSLQVFPLNGYGAILSGDHLFYVNKKGEKEFLDGLARFTHVWRFQNNEWKMHRVLSYDHRPASDENLRKVKALIIARYAAK